MVAWVCRAFARHEMPSAGSDLPHSPNRRFDHQQQTANASVRIQRPPELRVRCRPDEFQPG
jgi:hypothetical protein